MSIDPRVDIGHVHLKVSDIDRAIAFYEGVLGFEVMLRARDEAAFVSAGGYHHHIGLEHVGVQRRRPAAAKHDRPLPHGDSLSGPQGARGGAAPRRPGRYSRPAVRAITASARRSTSATRTTTASSSTATARRRNGPKNPDGSFTMISAPLDLDALLAELD